MTWRRRFKNELSWPPLENDRQDFLKGDVTRVRSLVVPPRDVHSKLLRRQPSKRMVECFDLLLRVTQECPVAGLLEDRVSPHREVGTVDLQVEPCSYDSLVFDPHRCREGMEVGNVCGIKAVRVEDSNQ